MPLEIRELVIKVTVEEKAGTPQGDMGKAIQAIKAQVVKECLEKMRLNQESELER